MRTTAFLSLFLLMACAGSPPPPRTQYLMRADVAEQVTRVETPVSIGLQRVTVAPYLGQNGVVVETEIHQIRPARYHLWAEPLDEGLRQLLRAEISKSLGYEISGDPAQRAGWDYAVDVGVEEFHGTLSGDARLIADWRITRGAAFEEVGSFRFARSVPLAREGYAGLVEAEIGLARELAVAIAGSLRDVIEVSSREP